jgi:hypothetical protein
VRVESNGADQLARAPHFDIDKLRAAQIVAFPARYVETPLARKF